MNNDGNIDLAQLARLSTMLGRSGDGSNFLNQYEGIITPKRKPTFQTPPIFNAKYKLGDSERFFISVRIYVQDATMQYPESACKISFYDASKGCYTKLNGTNDIRDLSRWLNEQADEIDKIMPAVMAKELKVKQGLEAYRVTQMLGDTDQEE